MLSEYIHDLTPIPGAKAAIAEQNITLELFPEVESILFCPDLRANSANGISGQNGELQPLVAQRRPDPGKIE